MPTHKYLLLLILTISLFLNTWGINWGLPERWHPDETTYLAESMHQNRSLIHGYYAYGSLPYYQTIVTAIWPLDLLQPYLQLHPIEIKTLHVTIARLTTAIMATGIVLLTYLISKILYNRRAALISAALLASSMTLVNLAHFATPDIPSLFWMMLAAYHSTKLWRTGSKKHYLLTGLFIGAAAAVKYIGGIIIIPLLTAHYLRKRQDSSFINLFQGISTAIISFFIFNTPALITPCRFLLGFTQENLFNAYRNITASKAYIPFLTEYINAAGWPLAILSAVSLIYAIWLLQKSRYRAKIILLISMFLPYYLIIGNMHTHNLRYTLPLQPFLIILIGKMTSDFLIRLPRFQKYIWLVILTLTLTYSALYSIAADLTLINDSRTQLKNWIQNNADFKDSIETTTYTIGQFYFFPDITFRPHDSAEWSARKELRQDKKYHYLLKQTHWLIEKGIKFNYCVAGDPTNYKPWHESLTKLHAKKTKNFDVSSKGLIDRNPDWLIISEFYYQRFFQQENNTKEKTFFKHLLADKLPYKKVKEIKYQGWLGLKPQVEFANPKIIIYTPK